MQQQWVGYTILVGMIAVCWGGGIAVAFNSYDKMGVWVCFLVGSIFAIMLAYAVLAERKASRRRQFVDRDYDEILTTLVRIEMLGKDHYYVHTKWVDNNGGAEYYFKSDYITQDPTDFVNGRKIPVRISRKNHALYYVNLSFIKQQEFSQVLEHDLGINRDGDQGREIAKLPKITPQTDVMVSNTDIGKILIYFLGAFGMAGIASILTAFIVGELLFIVVGLFFCLFWIPVIMIARKRSEQADLYYNGHQLLTKIEEVAYEASRNENNSLEIKGFYRVKTSWYDAESDTIYHFKSQLLVNNPEPYLSEIKGINVYVDPNNFLKNYMDLSFLPPQFHVRKI